MAGNRKLPDFYFERKLWLKGCEFVAGCDEVGRGCFAGPVVCGCVAFDKKTLNEIFTNETPKIDDSKKLTSKQREVADKWIRKNCLTWGVGIGTVAEINNRGIVSATSSGFRRAT